MVALLWAALALWGNVDFESMYGIILQVAAADLACVT